MPYTTLMLIIVLFGLIAAATYYGSTKPEYASLEDKAEPLPVHETEDEYLSADDYLLTVEEFDNLNHNIVEGLPEYAPAVPYLVPSDTLHNSTDVTLFTFMLLVFEAETSC